MQVVVRSLTSLSLCLINAGRTNAFTKGSRGALTSCDCFISDKISAACYKQEKFTMLRTGCKICLFSEKYAFQYTLSCLRIASLVWGGCDNCFPMEERRCTDLVIAR